jgi:hypothetical protein
VTLTVPAADQYLRSVRLVASDLALMAGFDAEEAEDLRIGIGELCFHLVEMGALRMTVRFQVELGCVTARGLARRVRSLRPPSLRGTSLDGVSGMVVRGVVDYHEVVDDDDVVTFIMVKRVGVAV